MKKTWILLLIFFSAGILSYADAQSVKNLNTKEFKVQIWDFEKNKDWKYLGDKPAIIDMYAEQTKESPYLLPILTGKESSPYTAYRKIEHNTNYNLKRIGEMVGLKIPLTTYVARHTWASVALHMNIPIATISQGMGHNSYTTTQIYLQSLDVATINEANERIIKRILKEL